MINKVKGAEKLESILRRVYNNSFRELLFEFSALKTFIYDYHSEIVSLLDDEELDKEMLNMSFLDTVNNIKEISNINMGKIKNKIRHLNNHDINFNNMDKCLNNEKIDN